MIYQSLIDACLKNFDGGEQPIHCDISKLKGAIVIGGTVELYQVLSFLGVRTIGCTTVNYISETQDIVDYLTEDEYVTVVAIHNKALSPSIDIGPLKAYAKSIGKVLFIYDRDKNIAFLRDVNEFRSVDPTFC